MDMPLPKFLPERPAVSTSFSENQAVAAIPDYDESNDEEVNNDDE